MNQCIPCAGGRGWGGFPCKSEGDDRSLTILSINLQTNPYILPPISHIVSLSSLCVGQISLAARGANNGLSRVAMLYCVYPAQWDQRKVI